MSIMLLWWALHLVSALQEDGSLEVVIVLYHHCMDLEWIVSSTSRFRYTVAKRGASYLDVLQFTIVTSDEKFRVVNACQNQDLFWALRGGGGAFGVRLSPFLALMDHFSLLHK
jgi:hypothetical protein